MDYEKLINLLEMKKKRKRLKKRSPYYLWYIFFVLNDSLIWLISLQIFIKSRITKIPMVLNFSSRVHA